MRKLRVGIKGYQYYIHIGERLERLGRIAKGLGYHGKVLIVTNRKVGGLYLAQVRKGLRREGFVVNTAWVGDGERFKSLPVLLRLYDICVKYELERDSLIVALGGGVIGDIAGFLASTYLRGLPYIQLPTTLLAQVDSSVGGKVAVNHPRGKNLIGDFYQPKCVLVDLRALDTLNKREMRVGVSEVIKYGIIKDPSLFNFLERNIDKVKRLDRKSLEEIVFSSCRIKARVVEKDEKEKNLRQILNFGHTIGHAIEATSHYKGYKHGEAVAIGMIGASIIASKKGFVDEGFVERIKGLIRRAGLPTKLKRGNIGEILRAMRLDKKVRDGRIRFVLPKRIGYVTFGNRVSTSLVRKALREME